MILGITPRLQSKNNQPNYMSKTSYKAVSDTVSFTRNSALKVPLEKETKVLLYSVGELMFGEAGKMTGFLLEKSRVMMKALKKRGLEMSIQVTPRWSNGNITKKPNSPLVTFARNALKDTPCYTVTEGKNTFSIVLTPQGYIQSTPGSTKKDLNLEVQRILKNIKQIIS